MGIEPIKVVSATGIWQAAGTWLSAIGIGAVLVAIVRQAVPWRRTAADERAADFDRLRMDVVTAKADAKAAMDDAKEARAIAQRLENMVACLRPAISILSAEVRRLDPDPGSNAALIQVQELMGMAVAGDFGFGAAMRDLATIRGKGETT